MYVSFLSTRAWTPRCLQKWPRHPPTDKATYGFTLPPCWKDRKKIPSTPVASNCQTLAGLLQLNPRELDQHPDLPATDVERVPGSCQDQQWLRRLGQWPEPARQRTFAATPLHLNPAITPGSQLGEHANPSGFRQKAQETPAVDLQSYAEKTLRPLEAAWGRPKELEGASGGLFSPRSSNVNINKDKQTHKKRLL